MIGAMAQYVSVGGAGKFQPMNANYGLVPPLAERVKGPKSLRNEMSAHRALDVLEQFCETEQVFMANKEE